MNKQGTYRKNAVAVGILFLVLSPLFCWAQVYHVDPNQNVIRLEKNGKMEDRVIIKNNEEMVPDKMKLTSSNKIIIQNNYNSPISLVISRDKEKWDTVKVAEKSSLSRSEKTLYVKLFSTASQYKLYVLNADKIYGLSWKKEVGWQLIERVQ